MAQYRITENPEGAFRVYQKKWGFWFRVDCLYYNRLDLAQENVRSLQKTDTFKVRHWYYGDLK